MSENWTVSVGGRSYGPYSAAQMRAFASEGRLAPQSLVATASDKEFRPASEDPFLAALFRPAEFDPSPAPVAAPQSFGRNETSTSNERSHFVIIADMKSGSLAGLEEEIFNFGPTYPVLPQVWILSSDATVNGIRNALVQKLGKLDGLFVVDATHNKAAWFNFGPEADARIRKIWMRGGDLGGRRAAE